MTLHATPAPPTPNGAAPPGDPLREHVFLDRYALKGADGQPVEQTPEEMWRRVADAIAAVEPTAELRETWRGRFLEALRGFRFVPGGRILAGAGSGHAVTFFNCLPPDQRVLTSEGYRPISDVRPGDEVMTHRGRLRRVIRRFEREADEPLFTIRTKKLRFDSVRVTGEHPVLVWRRDGKDWQEPAWVKAAEVRRGDYVATTCLRDARSSGNPEIDLGAYLPEGKYDMRGDRIELPVVRAQRGRLVSPGLRYTLPSRVAVDADLAYLIGTWLGDGCVTHRARTSVPVGIQISFRPEHADRLERCAATIRRVFGVPTRVTRSETQRCTWLWANSMPLGELFQALFGHGFAAKRIPSWLAQAELPLIRELLRGLFHSDGCLHLTPAHRSDTVFIQVSNRDLAIQVHQLLMRLGHVFNIRLSGRRDPRAQPAYRVVAAPSECPDLVQEFFGHDVDGRRGARSHVTRDGLHWVRVDEVRQEPYRGQVVDLEVEDDHSFITAGVVVSNCYVLPSPEDSRAGILDNLKLVVEVMARGGGVGVNLSTLRPRGSHIRSVNGTSSGPCSWAELYSVATGDVIQQGGSRRGALMLMLDDDHPDIEEFITVKTDLSRLHHANLSVCVSDAFMEAVRTDAEWALRWQGQVRKVVRARELWALICRSAWRSAEPGVVFIDRVNQQNNLAHCETIRCCNPCAEQMLGPWHVCNLGALNLAAFVQEGQLDLAALAEHARVAVRFLDDVVDANHYFFAENEEAQKGVRRIGLGTMGLADALLALEVRYGSDESLAVIEEIYRTIRDAAYDASADLAIEKGPFPRFERIGLLERPFIARLPERLQAKVLTRGLRNGVLLTQAPTGTTSLLAGASSGIEPVFDFTMVRKDRLGERVIEHPAYRAWRAAHPDEPLPPYFVTADQLSPEEHVRVQAKIQEFTDSSISKTVNAPSDHTVEDVERLYRLAYELGCKGVAYYRDGCREAVLHHGDGRQPAASAAPGGETQLRPRPAELAGTTRRAETPLGTAFVTVNRTDAGEPFEVFVNVGRAGSDVAALAEAIGRLCSLCLRLPGGMTAPARLAEIVDQLGGIGGAQSLGFGPRRVRSLPDAIARVLAGEETAGGGGITGYTPGPPAGRDRDLCPSCGAASLVSEGGCRTCRACGHSRC